MYGCRPSSEIRAENVDEQVGILIEPFRHGCQILGVVVEVGPEERRLGMPGDQANELGQQFLLGRIILAVKQPVGMLVQLVPALVVTIQGREERRRIGRVDHHGPMILGASLENRIEFVIVDFQQRAIFVANA